MLEAIQSATLFVNGVNLGDPGFFMPVRVEGKQLGVLNDGGNNFPLELAAGNQLPVNPLRVCLMAADEGTWFAPQRVELLVTLVNGKRYRVASWSPEDGVASADGFNSLILPLAWRTAEEVKIVRSTVRLDSRNTSTGGQWKGHFGQQAAWIPNATNIKPQKGFELQSSAATVSWSGGPNDSRVLEAPTGATSDHRATCWHHQDNLSFAITPPDSKPYRLRTFPVFSEAREE